MALALVSRSRPRPPTRPARLAPTVASITRSRRPPPRAPGVASTTGSRARTGRPPATPSAATSYGTSSDRSDDDDDLGIFQGLILTNEARFSGGKTWPVRGVFKFR